MLRLADREAFKIDDSTAVCRIDARMVVFGHQEILKEVFRRNGSARLPVRLLDELAKLGGIGAFTVARVEEVPMRGQPGEVVDLSWGISAILQPTAAVRFSVNPSRADIARQMSANNGAALFRSIIRKYRAVEIPVQKWLRHAKPDHEPPTLFWTFAPPEEDALDIARSIGKNFWQVQVTGIFSELQRRYLPSPKGLEWSGRLQARSKGSYSILGKELHRYRVKLESRTPTDIDLCVKDTRGRVLAFDLRPDHDCEVTFISENRERFSIEVGNLNPQNPAEFDVKVEEEPLQHDFGNDVLIAGSSRNGVLHDRAEIKLIALPHRTYRLELRGQAVNAKSPAPSGPLQLEVTGPGLNLHRIVHLQRGKVETFSIPPLPELRCYTIRLRPEQRQSRAVQYILRYLWAD